MLQLKIYLMIYFAKLINGFSKISTSVIYGQAIHETGNFKSEIFKENKNLFGMRQAKVRKNYAVGTERGHAVFKTHWDSIRDYFERQKYYKVSPVNDIDFMRTTVSSGYAEDKVYLKKWQEIVKNVKKPINSMYIGILFFFLVGAIVLMKSSKKQSKFKY